MNVSDLNARSRWLPRSRWPGIVAVALGVGVAVAWNVMRPRVVLAAGTPLSSDSDGDGLPNVLEPEFGCDAYHVDTDGDGYSDTEELARRSSPSQSSSIPGNAPASLGLAVTANGLNFRLVTMIYLADGSLTNKTLKLGVIKSSTPVYLPKAALGTSASLTVVPAAVPGQLVAVYESPLSATILRGSGAAAVFSMLSGPGGLKVADAVNLAKISDVVCQRFVLTTQPGGSTGTTLQVSSQQGTGAGGVVFKPIAGGSPPATWTPGEICNQTTSLVGYSGAAAIEEVVAAGCESGWDAYCDPTCSASVGTTITILDPAVLVGG